MVLEEYCHRYGRIYRLHQVILRHKWGILPVS